MTSGDENAEKTNNMKKLEEYQKKSITALLLEPGKYTFAVQSYNTEKADQTYTVEIKKVL